MTLSTPLISAADLQQRLADPAARVRVIDCSFDLTKPDAGRAAHEAGHLPGAVYLHLDEALSGPKTGLNGRHPLPERADFVRTVAALGVDDDTLVVAYDNAGGMYAARLWWMLRWTGHARAVVLDGGLAAWKAAGLPLETGTAPPPAAGGYSLRDSLTSTVDHAGVKANLDTRERLVLDARAPDRFRGENETLDPVGGHIPGARNRLFRDNLAADGRFKPAAALKAEFEQVLGGWPPSAVINQCGSGVTACHNLLAMEVAGLHGAALYPGSWSEWCAQPGAPIAIGNEP
jgi:thiosulfate/3-mercaptopyruvate sulfurtransferase